jgi:hypothetical protein
MPDETATLKQALGALREASGAMVGLRRAYDELAADYERLRQERDHLRKERRYDEQRGVQRERERIASLFDDINPEWAAVIRNGTVSKDELFSSIDEQRAPTLERRRNQAIAANFADKLNSEQDVCVWRVIRGHFSDYYDTCEGIGPPENRLSKGFRCCPYCGRPIRIEGGSDE